MYQLIQGISFINRNRAFSVNIVLIFAGLSAAALFLIYPWWASIGHEPIPDFGKIIYFDVKGGISYENQTYYVSRQQSFKQLTRIVRGRVTLKNGSDLDIVKVDPTFFSIFSKQNAESGVIFNEKDSGDIAKNNIVISNRLLHSLHYLSESAKNRMDLFLETTSGNYRVVGVIDKFYFPTNNLAWTLISDRELKITGRSGMSFIGLLNQGVSIAEAQKEFDKLMSELPGKDSSPSPAANFVKFSEYSRYGFDIDLKIISALLLCLLLSGVSSISGSMLAELLKKDKGWKISHLIGISPGKLIAAPAIYLLSLLIMGALLGLVIYSLVYPFVEKYQIIKSEGAPFWWQLTPTIVKSIKFQLALIGTTMAFVLGAIYLHLYARFINRSIKKVGRNNSNWLDLYYWILLSAQNVIAIWIIFYVFILCFAYYQETQSNRGFNYENLLTLSLNKNLNVTKNEVLLKGETILGLAPNEFCVGGEVPGDSKYSTYSTFRAHHEITSQNPVAIMEVSKFCFDIYSIEVIIGRYFNEFDLENSENVIIIDRETAKLFGGERDALGKMVMLHPDSFFFKRNYKIVGIANNINGNPYRLATVYIPLGQGLTAPKDMKITARINKKTVHENIVARVESSPEIFHGHEMLSNIIKKSGDPYLSRIFNFLPSGLLIMVMLILCIKAIVIRILQLKNREIGVMLNLGVRKFTIVKRIITKYLIAVVLSCIFVFTYIDYFATTKWMMYITNVSEFRNSLLGGIVIMFFGVETYFLLIPILKKIKLPVSKLLKYDS